MGLLTLKTNSGTASATQAGFAVSPLQVDIRFKGDTLINATFGGLVVARLHNGTADTANSRLEITMFQDNLERNILASWRTDEGMFGAGSGVADVATIDSDAYYVFRTRHDADGTRHAFMYDDTGAAFGSTQSLGAQTPVFAGYTTFRLERNGVDATIDGVAIRDAAYSGAANDVPLESDTSLLAYWAHVNTDNEVSGGTAYTMGGSSPTDYEFTAGGVWGEFPTPAAPGDLADFTSGSPFTLNQSMSTGTLMVITDA